MVQAQFHSKILRLRAERLKRGWRLEDVACYAKLSAADICRIENRRLIPYPSQAQRLAAVLGITPEELTQEVDE